MDYNFDVIEYVENYIKQQNALYERCDVLYDPPVWEYLVKSEMKSWLFSDEVPSMTFIYFTVRDPNAGEYCKSYHQLVVGCYGVQVYYHDQNVIDKNKNFPLSDVKLKFTNWCKHILNKLEK